MTKAIVIGDILCLHISDTFIKEYIVEDICIYIAEHGNYEIGLFFKDNDEPTPYWQFLDLNKAGMFWKKGQEKVMEVIRKNRS
ncbi:MAG TPA: hypothetical protein PLF17_09800 [Chitinophagaceae bacterium]|nr:hypothetical protein [Chitinophagaceae bacterium]